MDVSIVKTLTCVTYLMDEALLSTSLSGRGQLVKILITRVLLGIFGSNCLLIYLKTESQWYAKW